MTFFQIFISNLNRISVRVFFSILDVVLHTLNILFNESSIPSYSLSNGYKYGQPKPLIYFPQYLALLRSLRLFRPTPLVTSIFSVSYCSTLWCSSTYLLRKQMISVYTLISQHVTYLNFCGQENLIKTKTQLRSPNKSQNPNKVNKSVI